MEKKAFLLLLGILIMLPFAVYKVYMAMHFSSGEISIPNDGSNLITVEPFGLMKSIAYWEQEALQISMITGVISAALIFLLSVFTFKKSGESTHESTHIHQEIDIEKLDIDTKGYLEIIRKRKEQAPENFVPYKKDLKWLKSDSWDKPYYGKKRVTYHCGEKNNK
ncbi:hypothetical protein [Brevibacillus reuszeri]|uniref:hypothetical protein n=1 Tax=Brevibacillus reuszeri TaxID=54915 RepID=UPI000CCC1731|nr:hypothetical protein [Brevibacillus reuszeri]